MTNGWISTILTRGLFDPVRVQQPFVISSIGKKTILFTAMVLADRSGMHRCVGNASRLSNVLCLSDRFRVRKHIPMLNCLLIHP